VYKRQAESNRAKAQNLLRLVGLQAQADRLASDLSYGEQKLVEIARTLATDADLVMLDEPMAGLSNDMVRKMTGVMQELKKMGKTILFVEHNLHVVMDLSDRIFAVSYGEEIARGTPAEIRANQRVIDAYLGRSADS
jgi:branched-chain amino acid transport system ATP-binding protein